MDRPPFARVRVLQNAAAGCSNGRGCSREIVTGRAGRQSSRLDHREPNAATTMGLQKRLGVGDDRPATHGRGADRPRRAF
jgi:hypothetical protein